MKEIKRRNFNAERSLKALADFLGTIIVTALSGASLGLTRSVAAGMGVEGPLPHQAHSDE